MLQIVRLAALALIAALGLSAPAAAQWTFCNQTSFVVEIAIAYDEGGRRITEGWTRIRPGGCEATRDQELSPGVHYFFARSSDAHRGGRRVWSGNDEHCVDANNFYLVGEAICEVGFEERRFVSISVEGPQHETRLTESVEQDPERAYISGVQRLLQDAGYDIRLIDGYEGRRTTRAIRRFLEENDLPAGLEGDPFIDALEEAAINHSDNVGLRLCNRTESEVWTAIALRRNEAWESRGWWPLAAEQCAKVIDEALSEPAYYVYAGLRSDESDLILSAADETFCLGATRFEIAGREDCLERGHFEGRFLTVLTQEREAVTLNFSDEQFSPPGEAGGAP